MANKTTQKIELDEKYIELDGDLKSLVLTIKYDKTRINKDTFDREVRPALIALGESIKVDFENIFNQ